MSLQKKRFLKRRSPLAPDLLKPDAARVQAKRRTVFAPWRLSIVLLFMFALFATVTARVLAIQIFEAPDLAKKSAKARGVSHQRVRRGDITDRNGVMLAQDTLTYEVYAHPETLAKQGVPTRALARLLLPFVDTSEGEPSEVRLKSLQAELAGTQPTVTLARKLPKDRVAQLKALTVSEVAPENASASSGETLSETLKVSEIIGLDFVPRWIRKYPQGSLAAHVLGFANDEKDVLSGIEAYADTFLQTPIQLAQVPTAQVGLAKTDLMSARALASIPEGQTLQLTLDARLQYEVEVALKSGLERSKAKAGTAIVMIPKTGEILAFATLPDYEPEKFWQTEQARLKNWALSDIYPPGSTMKILTVAAGLETGAINPDTKILDTGRMTIGGWPIQNYDYHKFPNPGYISLKYLLQHSSNIGSAKIGLAMPKLAYYNQLRRFGMGQQTGIALPGETAGILPKPERWSPSTQANLAFGYGLGATPVQMAAAVNTIANNGVWVRPQLIKTRGVSGGQAQAQKRPYRALSSQNARETRALLEASFAAGKPKDKIIQGLRVAGKTGTSRKPNADGKPGYSNDLYTSFAGFFPAQSPKILVLVVIDSPKIAESWGSTVALPVFNEIAKASASLLDLNQLPSPSFSASSASSSSSSSSLSPVLSPSHSKQLNHG